MLIYIFPEADEFVTETIAQTPVQPLQNQGKMMVGEKPRIYDNSNQMEVE